MQNTDHNTLYDPQVHLYLIYMNSCILPDLISYFMKDKTSIAAPTLFPSSFHYCISILQIILNFA